MAKRARRSGGNIKHSFRNKLLLNQWMISLFGIDPLIESKVNGKVVHPFHRLAEPIRDPRMEGLDNDNLHKFYHNLVNSDLFWNHVSLISREQILAYEENIARHTQAVNEKRRRPVAWKYFQWLTLLFVEIYLDRFFGNREGLLSELNDFVERFNRHWVDYADVLPYGEDDLNKLCLQNATGSGKTLLMHVNLLQYRHYARLYGRDKDLSRVILLTPNERLSEQHMEDFQRSGMIADKAIESLKDSLSWQRVDVLEITKLADQEGPNTIAARSLGDRNLLLVDEGHRGLSGKDAKKNENAWFKYRSMLCEKGFTFEYSATFEQAVSGTGHEDDYAKTVLFDYSYRWFYEDGFGKDYQILNMPSTFSQVQFAYLTACLLKFYQQLRIYEEKAGEFAPFNLEKPLWVFVGSTVSKAKGGSQDETIVAADVAQIICFIAAFLSNGSAGQKVINDLLTGGGQNLGLLDRENRDIFAGSFTYLAQAMNAGESMDAIYRDVLARLFNNSAGGNLSLGRIKGESGEVALRVGTSEIPFGLINVGDAKSLCDHVADVASQNGIHLTVEESDFTGAMFASVRDSASPINLLIGSKKFVEGWDCWRVSTMGLMHVGKSEGAQIIQLFGRGVRLKGYAWSLKRSSRFHAPVHPTFIEELETLNVFGIEADFMEKFREFLRGEGLPGNERRKIITIPLNVTYGFGKKLKVLRPKRKASDGKEYNFKKDAPVPAVGDVPEYLTRNTIVADWYPRIQSMAAGVAAGALAVKNKAVLGEQHLALLDYDALFFELEQSKRERHRHNLNISKEGIRALLKRNDWYTLYLPAARMNPDNFDGVRLLQQVATELLKRYCDHYYDYRAREFIEPRLELRELLPADDNIPKDEFYSLIVDGDEAQLIQGIEQLKNELAEKKKDLLKVGDLHACNFSKHLFQPLFHVRRGGKITILPVALGESEYQFVTDLKAWCDNNKAELEKNGMELFLLRNMSRGQGVGFFEAAGFHPDFILWMLVEDKQYVNFIEPHGLLHEGPASEKVLFYKRIKDIEQRLNDSAIILNSFILSWTKYPQLKWGNTQEELERMNVFFMTDDHDHYLDKLFASIRNSTE